MLYIKDRRLEDIIDRYKDRDRDKDRFESMNCFKKYKSYTSTNNIPTFCR